LPAELDALVPEQVLDGGLADAITIRQLTTGSTRQVCLAELVDGHSAQATGNGLWRIRDRLNTTTVPTCGFGSNQHFP